MSKLLNILLQKSDPYYEWGFTVGGGRDIGVPIVIVKVTHGSLAAQYLTPGDRILKIDNLDTSLLRQAEVEVIISRPTNSIELLVEKCDGVDSEQVRKSDSSASRKSRCCYDSNHVRERFQSGQTSTSSESTDTMNAQSGLGSNSIRKRKQLFWDKCSRDNTNYSFGKGFSRLSNFVNGPLQDRMSRKDQWKRSFSEDLSDDCPSSNSTESKTYQSRPMHSVWSPSPTRKDRFRFTNVKTDAFNGNSSSDRIHSDSGSESYNSGSFYNRCESVGTESSTNQGYTVNCETPKTVSEQFSPECKFETFSPITESFSSNSKIFAENSEQFHEKSNVFSPSEPFSPTSEVFSTKSSFNFKSPLKKPSDFLKENLKQEDGRRTTSAARTSDCPWNSVNTLKQNSEFKRSISVSERSYSSSDGPMAFEKIEKVNESKHVETLLSNDGKNERFEKTEKKTELMMSENDGEIENRKLVNDFKSIERKIGETETCNKIKTHSEESIRTVTPPEFYDNNRQNVKSNEPNRANLCNHKVEIDSQVLHVDKVKQEMEDRCENEDFQSLVSLSSINENEQEKQIKSGVRNKDIFSADKKWTSSTPVPMAEITCTERAIEMAVQSEQKYENAGKIRQQNQISGGSDSPGPGSPQGCTGVVAPPPPPPPPSGPPAPPPPPPLGSGVLPTVRLSSEIPDRKKGGYEPPAAIQNAMMTKDKKPFTYTPGGLDLSEIRSPRMARRINRNANAPDTSVPQPRPSPLTNQPLPPSAMAAMQPQIAIPVFPQGGVGHPQLHHIGAPGGTYSAPPPPPPPPGQQSSSPQTSPPVQTFQPTLPTPPPVQKTPQPVYNQPSPPAMQKSPQPTYNQPSPPPMSVPKTQTQNRQNKQEQQPGSIYVPPIESQQPRSQLGSLYIPPVGQEEVKPAVQSPVQLNKAPTPWLSRSQSQKEKEVPPWVNREENVPSQPTSQQTLTQQQTRIIPIQFEGREQTSTPTNTRIIPIQVEGANSPVQNKQPNFQQQNQPQRQQSMYQQSSAPPYQQQQQQWQQQQYQQSPTPQQQWQQQQQSPIPQQQWQQQQSPQQQWQQSPQQQWQQQQQSSQQQWPQQQSQQQQRWKNQQPVYVHNKFNTGSQSPAPASNDQMDKPKQLQSQQSWGQTAENGTAPVQSRSFRVLQKITDTTDGSQSGIEQNEVPYNSQGVPLSQLRKLQLSDDDRALMNKVKTQVDEETFLHNESDPRYRGSSIPSRAFRMLQTMTGEGEEMEVPRSSVQNQVGQNRLGQGQQQSESPQPYIPPSEQQVQEPRKYTGSAIPSRSFRMLQAMTAGSDSSDRPGESEY